MRTVVVLSVLALVFAGCKKKTDYFSFDCVVYDQKINAAVEGASVVLKAQRADGGFNPNYDLLGSATTDSEGRFYIEVEKEVFFSYRVEVSHSQHFDGTFNINPDNVPFSTAYEATFNLEPKAWVSTHLQNQNLSQTATFAVEAETNVCTGCCTGGANIIQGTMVDTTFTCAVFGNQQVEVNGNYLDENGGVHQISETAFVQAFDTTVINIVY